MLGDVVTWNVVEDDSLLARPHENMAFQKVTILMPMYEKEAI